MDNKTNFKAIHQDTFIDVRKEIERPPSAISIGEISLGQNIYDRDFGTFGNFSCIVGASKSRKTYFKSAIGAGFIGGDTSKYFHGIKTHRKKNMYVLDFDTEQGKWHSQKVFKRVSKLVGGDYEYYKPFYLRKYDYKTRLEFIEWCILKSEYKEK